MRVQSTTRSQQRPPPRLPRRLPPRPPPSCSRTPSATGSRSSSPEAFGDGVTRGAAGRRRRRSLRMQSSAGCSGGATGQWIDGASGERRLHAHSLLRQSLGRWLQTHQSRGFVSWVAARATRRGVLAALGTAWSHFVHCGEASALRTWRAVALDGSEQRRLLRKGASFLCCGASLSAFARGRLHARHTQRQGSARPPSWPPSRW